MRIRYNRRTATKIKHGRVQPRNRHLPTGLLGYVIDRESPGRGCRHVLSKRDLLAFIDLLPDWNRLSQRLERIVLAGDATLDGHYAFYHREETGAIFLHAWQNDLWTEFDADHFESHRGLFERLGVCSDRTRDGVLCRFTERQARAFMLLHVFLHELGHHEDRLQQPHRKSTSGEDYAEQFAARRFEALWPHYVRVFGDPRRSG
ncbi:MAG: hypothetical protein JXQ71_09215 [Verrucomicrobia bacterium]|nr:hypothetical protein [Verrucomicrobiota bacterium]